MHSPCETSQSLWCSDFAFCFNGSRFSEILLEPDFAVNCTRFLLVFLQYNLKMSRDEDIALRGQLVGLVKAKYSAYMIAKTLEINKKKAERWKKEAEDDEERFLEGRHYSHRGNPKYSTREQKHALKTFERMQPRGSRSAAEEMNHTRTGKAPSSRSLRRWARRDGMNPYVQPPRPKLTKQHKRERLEFAKTHADTEFGTWNFNDQFRIAFPMKGTKKKPFWAKSSSKVQPKATQKFPKTLNVHAGITVHGTVPLLFYDPPMNSDKFIKLNDQQHIPNLVKIYKGHQFMYGHDRAAWFTSGETQTYFQHDTPSSVLVVSPTEFPPVSPDINLAEATMATVLGRVYDHKPKNIEQLKTFLIDEWNAVTPEELEHRYASLPGILKQIRRKKGGNTTR